MVSPHEEPDFRRRMQRIETLIQNIERAPDEAARSQARELVQAVLDLHAAALGKTLEHVAAAGDTGRAVIDALGRDELVSSVLMLHGLHPLDLETRVRQALEQLGPRLRARVELVEMADGFVRLRVEASGNGRPASAEGMKAAIEDAICDKAPDVAGIEIEGLPESAAVPHSTFVPVEELLGKMG
jgi:hypothetical protein